MNLNELVKEGKIHGVLYRQLTPHADDRGFFIEVAKQGDLFIPIKQTSFTVTHLSIIKAFHWHKDQTDLWFGASGRAKVILYDLRHNSPTNGEFETFYLGEPNYLLLLIPPKVAHGYMVLGTENFTLFYHTDRAYNHNRPDEERIPFDEYGTKIWEVENR